MSKDRDEIWQKWQDLVNMSPGGPDDGMETSDWRYSLMNWGHDPAK